MRRYAGYAILLAFALVLFVVAILGAVLASPIQGREPEPLGLAVCVTSFLLCLGVARLAEEFKPKKASNL